MGISRTVLLGRITQELELKQTPNGVSVLSFTVAVDRNSKEKQTDFISCVAWRQTAEFICKYFAKGQRIALTGRIQTGSYTDKDGNKRSTFDVVAENVEFCEPKKTSKPDVDADEGFKDLPADDDLPF